jgi:hypothetical protein
MWRSRRVGDHLLRLKLETGLSSTTVNLHHEALKFFCTHVLKRPQAVQKSLIRKRP